MSPSRQEFQKGGFAAFSTDMSAVARIVSCGGGMNDFMVKHHTTPQKKEEQTMNTTTKRATRRLAASIAIATALATSGAYAVTDRTWNGGSGGSVSAPLDIYKAENWSHSASPTTSDNLNFTFSELTYLTNSMANAAGTAICSQANFVDGDCVLVGAIRSSGNFRISRTNSGNTANVEVADGGTLYSGGILCIGNDGAKGTLTVNAGGTVHSVGDLRVGNNGSSTATLNLNGGTVKASRILKSQGSGTLNFDGGTIQATASSDSTKKLIHDNLAAVTVLSGGGTIDANGYSVTIAKAITGEGAMTFKGGGTITFSAVPTYTGGTTIALKTKVVASSKVAVLDNGLVVDCSKVYDSGDYTVFECSGGLTDTDLENVSFVNCVTEPVPEIVDGTSLVVHFDVKPMIVKTEATLVLSGKTLEDIAEGTFSARMGGAYVSDDTFRYTSGSVQGYNKVVGENSIIVEFQIYNNQTKCVVVEFTEENGDIYATALGAASVNGNHLGNKFYNAGGSYNGTVATTMTANGYGVFDLRVVTPTIHKWTLDANTDWSTIREGATLSAYDIVRITVTDAVAVLTVDEDVTVGQIQFVDGTGTTLNIASGVTVSAESYSGLGYVLNNGTFQKWGDGTVEMKFDQASRGVFVVNAGTLKAAGKRTPVVNIGTPIDGDPDETPRSNFLIDVKSGATYDVNGQSSVTASVRLADGAHFINSGSTVNNTYGQTIQLILAGNADVTATGNFGIYNTGARLDLGSYTIGINSGSNRDFMLGGTTITGDGTIAVTNGMLSVRNQSCAGEDCALSIGANGKLLIANNLTLSVKDFVNGGTFDTNSKGTLAVTGTFTPGTAAITNLTLAAGATVKATGTAQVVSTTFSASGTITVDASEITKAQLDAGDVAVLTVPAAFNPSGVTWAVSGATIDSTRAKWRTDEGGATKTLYLARPTGLMVIIR